MQATSHTPPQAVQEAARRALRKRAEKPPSQRGMTPVGLARARDLSHGRPVSLETIKRMKAYFDRHQKDKQGSSWEDYGKGRQAWDGWGGDAGYAWAKRLLVNRNRPGQMPDDQRKAMFAAMRRGGGRGGSAGRGGYHAARAAQAEAALPANASVFKAGMRGFFEGALGGLAITADTLTFGAFPALSRAADGFNGPGADVSRGAATVARESLLAASGIGLLSKAGAAYQGTRLAQTAAGKAIAPISAIAGFGTQQVLEDYNEATPNKHYYADKAVAMAAQLAGYIGSVGAFGTAFKGAKMALRAIPTGSKLAGSMAGQGSLSAADRIQQGVGLLDKGLSWTGQQAGKVIPGVAKGALRKVADAIGHVSDFTGSNLRDLARAPGALSKLTKAKKLADRSRAYRELDEISLAYPAKAGSSKVQPLTIYDSTTRSKTTIDADTLAAYLDRPLARRADKLMDVSGQLAGQAKRSLQKAGFVGGVMAGTGAYDEARIRGYQREARQAIDEGRDFMIPADQSRGVIGTLLSAAVGTALNNPGEKQIRPGRAKWQAQQGAYRAAYDAIEDAYEAGDISGSKYQQEMNALTSRKPYNPAGRELWTVAPAMAVLGNWKIGDALRKARRSTVTQATSAYDGDTVTVDHRFEGQTPFTAQRDGQTVDVDPRGRIRVLDINTPELSRPWAGQPEPEYYGPESAARMQEMVKDGQYVRVVQDSNPRASGTDKYGRQLAYIETLPKPFDQLLRLPYVGNLVPARDVGKTMVSEGLADIHYRSLSGRTDRGRAYDAARAQAQAAGTGIWSEQGRSELPWVGTEQTVQQRVQDSYQRATGQQLPDETPVSDIMTPLSLGLMTTGNVGLFGALQRAGRGTALGYNTTVAGVGAIEFNERAGRGYSYPAYRPNLPSQYDRARRGILESRGVVGF
jgi:endonuclease YncB( thermonuclease family)